MTSMFVQSLKRLYDAGRITIQEVQERLKKNQITEKEYSEIISE